MQYVKIEKDDKGRSVITCSQRILFWKRQRRYLAQERIAGEFYTWFELPSIHRVPDRLSFQLDAWRNEYA